MEIACEVDAETLGGMRKLGLARLLRDGQEGEAFSLVGGEGSAPTPLAYFVAGVAF